MKILFWGTPEVALPFLNHLLEKEHVVGVVTQTDKPASRGQNLQISPVKARAQEKNLPVLQPSKLKDPEFLKRIEELEPEAGIVVAYGRIIPPEAIRLFPKGLFNLHFSLLPLLRGAAPMQWALLNGEKQTGVTSFHIEEGLDSGPIVCQKAIGIAEEETAITLQEKLIPLALNVLDETLALVRLGQSQGKPQQGPFTLAPLLKKEDAKIDWSRPAEEASRKVRALIRMGAFCRTPEGKILKVLKAEPRGDAPQNAAPGSVCGFERNLGFLVKCGQGSLLILRLQHEGKKETDAWSYLQGARLKTGDSFS